MWVIIALIIIGWYSNAIGTSLLFDGCNPTHLFMVMNGGWFMTLLYQHEYTCQCSQSFRPILGIVWNYVVFKVISDISA